MGRFGDRRESLWTDSVRFDRKSEARAACPGIHYPVTSTTQSVSPVWYAPIGVPMTPPAATMPETHHLPRVSHGGRVVEFDRGLSLQLRISFEDGLFIASDSRFGLYGSGKSREQAFDDFSEFFVEFFAEITSSKDKDLPPSTREFKKTLAAFGTLRTDG
ncbi:MAG: hypothetical protein DRP45_04425 [Candidatus Zixiibacteriota bacterium]|nr:MAG: hypothetical protein DRP45_04425 [candidate division Zixibacteria bacterium]